MAAYRDNSTPKVDRGVYDLYRDFFDLAEKKRRWSLRDDIPWDKCNKDLDPAIADIVATFCAVELYLPDYVGKALPVNRTFRGRAWFTMNWGYEESKHSLALGDWLLRSGHRSEEQMTDFENEVFSHEWNLPMDSNRGMVCYSMVQERATWLHYRNLCKIIGEKGDPALYTLLRYIAVDECAHYNFFQRVLAMHLAEDREDTLEQMRRVLHAFAMPAVHMISDGRQRIAAVKDLKVFDDEIYFREVYTPILEQLGVSPHELRRRTRREYIQANSAILPAPVPAASEPLIRKTA